MDENRTLVASNAEGDAPASREELIALVASIIQSARMPQGRKRSRFVTIPADLHQSAHMILRREMGGHQEVTGEGETKQ